MTDLLHSLPVRLSLMASIVGGFALGMADRSAGSEGSLRETPIVKAIQNAEASVVNIQGSKSVKGEAADGGRPQLVNGMGTGVIIDPRGYAVTNLHVVQDVAKIEVTLADGTETTAKLLNFDPSTDLALIKIDAKDPLPVIAIGSSHDLMRGETVIAIGNPFGYQHTVTVGIVSALHRNVPVNGTQEYYDLIQTNADINPGNSGGPLINIDGEMIGINVAVRVGAQGIGFAIPIDAALEVIADLVASSQRQQVSLGMAFRGVRDSEGSYLEVASASLHGQQPSADIASGDRLLAVDSQPIRSRLDLELRLLNRQQGEALNLEIERGGQKLARTLSLMGSPLAAASSKVNLDDLAWERLGIRVTELRAEEISTASGSYKGGLKVVAVRGNSPAAQRQIQVGDVLVGMMNWQTPTIDHLQYVLQSPEFKQSPKVKFYLMRGTMTYIGDLQNTAKATR